MTHPPLLHVLISVAVFLASYALVAIGGSQAKVDLGGTVISGITVIVKCSVPIPVEFFGGMFPTLSESSH